ncbi:MAG: TIGR01621 family pseudouridine synthase [Colwellia sp.]|nr:TIGR01621 family pseudouridine synthase [Colwellia sp.]MCW8865695.1 TIGR01621 family pseudouridine synthase [Colwellia sp.]MCW9080117.1 TIGR01621 family pseudouridine synthase [Colwellia sp.]
MFKIITQTADFVVVAKRANVNFHDEGELGSGLFSQVKSHLKKHLGITELFPIHRLDKMTSGLIIFATNLTSAQIFSDLFKHHQVEKYYLAISDKKPSKKQGLIKGDMAKSRRGMYKLIRSMENPAITQFFSYAQAKGKRLYLLKPHSGKTHQLRVALSSIGSPIIGDPLYYPKKALISEKEPSPDRGYLHAYALRFNFCDKQYHFTFAPDEGEFFLTEDIEDKLNELGQPWLLSWPKI